MSKQIEISMDSIQELLDQIIDYFSGLNLYQIIAWSAIGVGFILVVVSLFLF